MKNNQKTLIKGIILLMLVAVIGTTYAYFAANITGNESISTIVVTGGTMEIVYANNAGSEVITEPNIYPRNNAWITKTFTVTGNNSTDKDMKYKLGLKVDNNTFSSSALTYSLTSTNTSNKGSVVTSKTNQTIYGSEVIFGTGIYPKGENMVHTYTFELYFKDTGENQNKDQGKTFAGHIIIEEARFNEIALSANNLSLIGYTNGVVPQDLIIPSSYVDENGDTNYIVSIADYAFGTGNFDDGTYEPLPNFTLNAVTLNEGLKSIGDYSFARIKMSNIVTFDMPSTLKHIGTGAFYETNAVLSRVISVQSNFFLDLNEGLEIINSYAFYGAIINPANSNYDIRIPSTVKKIGDYAFAETGFTKIMYSGSEAEWNQIDIGINAFPDGFIVSFAN